jgi:hypothetical protein
MRKALAFLSLFASLSTLICCALPALFILLGFGAAFASLISSFPQLIWISENKMWFFVFGALALTFNGYWRWKNKDRDCPIDPVTQEACRSTRDWSTAIYYAAMACYAVGFIFSFILPTLFD